MSGFLEALRHLPDNPILRREWRSLAHELRDWRVWLYLRQPRDARGWAVRALSWGVLMPYLLWAILEAFRRPLMPWVARRWTFNPLAFCYLLVGLYVCWMCVAIMTPSIARERELDSWEALQGTPTSRHDLLVGLLAGRLVPVLLIYLLIGGIWSAIRPQYSPMLAELMSIGSSATLTLTGILAWLAFSSGLMALAFSAWCRTIVAAGALAAGAVLVLVGGFFWTLLQFSNVPGLAIGLAELGTVSVASYLGAEWGLWRESGE